MIQLVQMQHPEGALVWSRLAGSWGWLECERLETVLAELDLRPGARIVFDLSETEHLHFASVPALIALTADLELRGARVDLVGLTDYLTRIFEFSGGLEAREFVEQHRLEDSPPPGPADPGYEHEGGRMAFALDPHGLAVTSLN
jgi:MFS superfamily sulfate permease-like transporter